MKLYEYARKINKVRKEKKKEAAGRFLSPVRRLERFAPVSGERVVAMTFDDGPMNLPPNPVNDAYAQRSSLTALLVDILESFDATGTFNVIGSTAENYPDQKGGIHTTKWGGTMHDHYPSFGEDAHAGAANQPVLIDRLIKGGHELSNHGYRHVLFGPNKLIYGSRYHFRTLDEVVGDLMRLHALLEKKHNVQMTLSRPPHYIDRMRDGFDSYTAYAALGYDYLAASFDGGGWLPTTGDYEADVRKMVEPLEKLLLADPHALNGQIIFQKDGYNMSLMTPVAHGLPAHLRLLRDNGYRVVTVSELKQRSAFEDIDTAADYTEKLRDLDGKGYVIGYKNNTFKPDKVLTHGEMLTMTLTKEDYSAFIKREILGKEDKRTAKKHPYYPAYQKYGLLDSLDKSGEPATVQEVQKFLYEKLGADVAVGSENEMRRREYLCLLPF